MSANDTINKVLDEFGTHPCSVGDDCKHFDCIADRKMAAEIIRLRAVLAKLRDPSDGVILAGHLAASRWISPFRSVMSYWAAALAAVVTAAEADVDGAQLSLVEPTDTKNHTLCLLKESMTLSQAVDLYGSATEPEVGQ